MTDHAPQSYFRNLPAVPLVNPAARYRLIIFLCLLVGALALGAVLMMQFGQTSYNQPMLLLIAAGVVAVLGPIGLVAGRVDRNRARVADRQRKATLAFDTDPGAMMLTLGPGRAGEALTNAGFQRLVGPSAGGGMAALERLVVAGDDMRRQQLQQMRKTAENGQSAAETVSVMAGSLKRQFQITATPVRTQPGAVIWRVTDATKPAETERQLATARLRLLSFIDNSSEALFSVDRNGRFVIANKVLADWMGVEVQDLVSGRYRLHDMLVEAPAKGDVWDIFPQGGPDQRGACLIRNFSDGTERRVAVTHLVLNGPDGVFTRTTMRDLTVDNRARPTPMASEPRLKRLFIDAPTGILLLAPDLNIIESNPAFAALVGGAAATLPGQNLLEMIAEDKRGQVSEALGRALAGEPLETPLEIMLDGRRKTAVHLFARRLQPLVDDDGQDGLICYVIDLTDQKAIESQLAQAQKMQAVGNLAGGIAHDFNNLLTGIGGFADLLLVKHQAGDPDFEYLNQIRQNSNRAADLVKQLLAFSRKQTLVPRILDVSERLADLKMMLNRLIGDDVNLSIRHGRDLGRVKVDPGQFDQVVVNLVVNASHAMPEGGDITVSTQHMEIVEDTPVQGSEIMPPGNYVMIDVQDTGTGIPADVLSRIFDPFFTTKGQGKGTGLGLSTVYGIIRQTGGFVDVVTAMGEGTSFRIYLPRHRVVQEAEALPAVEVDALTRDHTADTTEAVAKPAPKPAAKPTDLTGAETVLVVEDEDAARAFTTKALGMKGYNVLEACDGEEALEVIADPPHEIDLIISDVLMPGLDGPSMVKQIRSEGNNVKVLFISGHTEDKLEESDLDPATLNFLQKPYSLKGLTEKVREVLQAG
ncbi:MAG: PAS domain-containing protein [Alphaproteobacteria bacterium]